jgi:hypothetical protein
MLLSASLIWGCCVCCAVALALSYVGPYTFTAVRSALAAIVLGVLILILDKTSLKSKIPTKRCFGGGHYPGRCDDHREQSPTDRPRDHLRRNSGFITSLYIVLVRVFGLFIRKKPHPLL